MKVLFYSSNSNIFNKDTYLIKALPSWKTQWEEFCKNNSNDEYLSLSQLPALFLPENTRICKTDDTKQFAQKIADENCDLVIALSFWVTTFDWLNIKDSLIAEELRKLGVKVICNSVSTAMICFDKTQSHNFLIQHGINKANALFVDHELYFCGGNRKEIKYNIYKEGIINQIEKMKFPLIIKDPVSLSSYGMDVLHTKGEVINYLNSKKNNSNRLIEEFIDGENYGVEMYCYKNQSGNTECNIFPPLVFSTNKYGITSPKQSVKCGPIILNDELNKSLYELLIKLAQLFQFEGSVQIDLILSNNKWYLIEINPRLSGMTTSYCGSLNKNLYEIIKENLFEHKQYNHKDFRPVINFKFPILSDDKLNELKNQPGVFFINQINNLEAKQEREKGFCEIILTGKNKADLEENLNQLKNKYPEYMDESFYKCAVCFIQEKLK